jgi:NADH-quinone oxidoreductase subunit J
VSPVLFLLVAALAVLGALVVVVHKNPVYCALGLVGTLGAIAVFFLALDAEMVGVLQIIVYAGAIVVLFLFVINLLNLQVETEAMEAPALVAAATAGGVALAAMVGALVARAPLEAAALPEGYGGTRSLAERLFTTYLLPFELTSVLLLVAIVGAVVLGKRRTAP